MDPHYAIEPARPDDLPALPGIEREASRLFEGWGIGEDVLSDTTGADEFQEAQEDGLLWVARAADGRPVGFALTELVGGVPHLEEIDVLPDHGRRGLGAALVRAVCEWARAAGHGAVTLTTFRAVPWNAPFYARLGFRPLADPELTPALAALVREEGARGLDPALRVVMEISLGR